MSGEGFEMNRHGAGNFGRWGTDEAGRACYHYDPPPERDAPHENHWHLIGNERISVTCHNTGYVQIYDFTRGPKILNRWHPKSGNYAGGFCYIRAHGVTFPTLKPWLPEDATMERVFGQGYFKKVTRWRGLVVEEMALIPLKPSPTITFGFHVLNSGAETVDVVVAPFLQVNIHQLVVGPLMAHGLDHVVEWLRARVNRKYSYHNKTGLAPHMLEIEIVRNGARQLDRQQPVYADHHPGKLVLDCCAPKSSGLPKIMRSHSSLFRDGGLDSPAGLLVPSPETSEKLRSANGAGPIQCSIWNTTLQSGDDHICTSAMLYLLPMTSSRRASYKPDVSIADMRTNPAFPTITTSLPDLPWLSREIEWHSYYLQACTLYSEYFDAHFVDQGSAYGYLQGGSGAPRDLSLFVLALVYLRPDLAKETLRFMLRSQRHTDGGFPYAWFGYGKCSGGGVHSLSSDLDLFVMWALSEYLNVTHDFAFLEEDAVYYPKADGKHGKVLEHIRASWKHLTTKIGLGPHGLIRAGTGDWNDVLIAFSRVPPLTIWRGESSLNAGLATVALPAMADAIAHADPELATEMRAFAARQADALRTLWTGQWVARGYTGWRDNKLGVDRVFLDTQAFGVLGGVWTEEQRTTLFDNIQRICVDPQPAGALALYPPMRGPLLVPGSDTNGGTWAAVDGWTTWAWMLHDPAAAWAFFLRTTMAARAEAYPDNWYGIWSGPDAFNAHYHPKPEQTFNHNATPMHLFPIMNANRHALPLLDMVKFAGFGAKDGVITIEPRFPFDSFTVNTPLMGCTYAPDSCEGYYVPQVVGPIRIRVALPEGLQGKSLQVESTANFSIEDGRLHLNTIMKAGSTIRWRACLAS